MIKIKRKKIIIVGFGVAGRRYFEILKKKDFDILILRKSKNKHFEAMAINMNPCLDEGIFELKKNCFYFLKRNPFNNQKKFLPQD